MKFTQQSTFNMDFSYRLYDEIDRDYLYTLSRTNRLAITCESACGIPIGCVVLARRMNRLRICLFIVHPEYRQLGIGKKLMRVIINILNDDCNDATELYAIVPYAVDTAEYQAFLYNSGFRLTNVLPNGKGIMTYGRTI